MLVLFVCAVGIVECLNLAVNISRLLESAVVNSFAYGLQFFFLYFTR